MKILIVGDIHTEWAPFNKLLNQKQPDIVLQCGDYGWWPHKHKTKDTLYHGIFDQYGVKNIHNNKTTKIYWCPGNHENWDDLDNKGIDIVEIQPFIYYCPFGTTITLSDGRNVLFCGGASSIDYDRRILGQTWWQQETISQTEIDRLPDAKIDIIISHTVPRSWLETYPKICDSYILSDREKKYNDPSTFALDIVYEKYKPKWWFSGHFHKFYSAQIDNCKWTSLSMVNGYDKWWIELEENK